MIRMLMLLAGFFLAAPLSAWSQSGLVLTPRGEGLSGTSQVWVVAANGSGDFVDLQPAIDAAAPGDAILLKPAPLPYSTSYIDKSLTIMGDGPGRVAVGEMWLQFAKDVVLCQLSIEPTGNLIGTAGLLLDGIDRIWVEDCEIRPAAERNSSVLVSEPFTGGSAGAVLVRCQVFGE